MTSWKGRSSPAAASYATTSPSRIASRGPRPVCSSSTTSGNWVLTRSCRRVNSSIWPSAVRCACSRMPSYLYSAMHCPPSLARISSASDNRWASMTRTGLPARTRSCLDCSQSARHQRRRDEAEIAADVVRPLQHRPVLAAARVHLRQRVENRRRADSQPQTAGDQAQQVAGLQRSGPRQKAGEQLELAALRARSFGAGDLVQCVDDCGNLQAWLPIAGRGSQ